MKRNHKNMNYPPTDLVILAGGQAQEVLHFGGLENFNANGESPFRGGGVR